MSARAAKRWAGRLVYVWLGMWLSTALLPCSEVVAAVAAHELALGPDCGHPVESDHGASGGHKTAACLDIDEPAPAPAERLAVPVGGSFAQPAAVVTASSYRLPLPPPPSLPRAYAAAPPPFAFYLRSSRLLI